jgi:hypothetical protein
LLLYSFCEALHGSAEYQLWLVSDKEFPPQTFFYAVLLQNFEVAPILIPFSEANQNWYSAEPCQSYQTKYGNMTAKATKKSFSENTKKTKKTTTFFNPKTDPDPDRRPTFQQKKHDPDPDRLPAGL